jgi:UDP-galactopyranose mutase
MDLAAARMPEAYFAGRLADFRYYDMDQAVLRALVRFREIAQGTRPDRAFEPLASAAS